MRSRLWRSVLSLAFVLGAFALPAPAAAFNVAADGVYPWLDYDRTGSSGYDHYIPVCLSQSMGGATWNLSENKAWAAWTGFSRWNAISGGELQYYTSDTSCNYMAEHDWSYVSVWRITDNWVATTGADEDDIARTNKEVTICFDPTPHQCIDQAHIYLNAEFFTFDFVNETGLDPGVKSAKVALTHEFGHSFGCGHASVSGKVMSGSYSAMKKPATLTTDDENCYYNWY